MLKLPGLTIWAACWSGDPWMHDRTLRVLHYCSRIIECDRFVFFVGNRVPTHPRFDLDVIEIRFATWETWNLFCVRELCHWINTPYVLSIHEDGFPIDPSLWDPSWLEWDYLGAPWDPKQCCGWPVGSGWEDQLLTGNGGFCLQSKKMLDLCMELPADPRLGPTASDVFVCRLHREFFIDRGIRFAPPEIAARFSTEQTHKDIPSFGFHGRKDSPDKYQRGWAQICAMEEGCHA